MPATVISSTLDGPFDWPGGATVARGDAVEIVARLKEESDLPLRSHGSLTLNRALLAAGLVDRVQVTIFPVINSRSQSNDNRIFEDTGDLDLELIESHIFDGHTQQLVYRPSLHA
jgi:dihydrofolate reductase